MKSKFFCEKFLRTMKKCVIVVFLPFYFGGKGSRFSRLGLDAVILEFISEIFGHRVKRGCEIEKNRRKLLAF